MLKSLAGVLSRRRRVTTALLVPLLLVGCAGSAAVSFDPSAPCTADGQREGAYPELEAELPSTFNGAEPKRRDSGRNCTDTALGTLAQHGIEELRFAGALWETGKRSGVTVAVFRAPGLNAERLTEFYEAGAREARKTTDTQVRTVRVDGVKGHRLDTMNDESFQSILVFDDEPADLVRAVLVASDAREVQTKKAHEDVVRRAAAAALGP